MRKKLKKKHKTPLNDSQRRRKVKQNWLHSQLNKYKRRKKNLKHKKINKYIDKQKCK